jgi:hypothetical protein
LSNFPPDVDAFGGTEVIVISVLIVPKILRHADNEMPYASPDSTSQVAEMKGLFVDSKYGGTDSGGRLNGTLNSDWTVCICRKS